MPTANATSAAVHATAPAADEIGTLWWIAQDETELRTWRNRYAGVDFISSRPHADGSTRVDVFLSLPKARALELLGHQPDDEEWLDLDAGDGVNGAAS